VLESVTGCLPSGSRFRRAIAREVTHFISRTS
jgi:hypothetical protein